MTRKNGLPRVSTETPIVPLDLPVGLLLVLGEAVQPKKIGAATTNKRMRCITRCSCFFGDTSGRHRSITVRRSRRAAPDRPVASLSPHGYPSSNVDLVAPRKGMSCDR